MDANFWHDKWKNNEIGFHLDEVNPYLRKHWCALNITPDDTIFVPLCGKSQDLIWLAERTKHVIGIELSQKAVDAFFTDNALTPTIHPLEHFTQYQCNNLTILCGDLFQLSPDLLADCRFIYDRASLIAFPPHMRNRYVKKLDQLMTSAAQQRLLVSLEYPQHEMSGPPFSVPDDSVRQYFSTTFDIKQLESKDILEKAQRFKDKGVTQMLERVYLLNKR